MHNTKRSENNQLCIYGTNEDEQSNTSYTAGSLRFPNPRHVKGISFGIIDEMTLAWLDMTYYNVLEVPSDASAVLIRKQYYALAMRYHPDKNAGNKHAEEMFKKVSEAYQILSDPKLREKYDSLGLEAMSPEGGFMNPEEFFKTMFGGDKFVNIIGEISLGKMMNEFIHEQARQSDPYNTTSSSRAGGESDVSSFLNKERQEQYKKLHEERVNFLLHHLKKKISLLTEHVLTESQFREYIQKEANELKQESYGVPLLHSIGYVYSSKAKQTLGKESFLGLSSFVTNVKEKGHIVASLFDTIGAVRQVANEANIAERRELEARKQQQLYGGGVYEPNTEPIPMQVSEDKVKLALWKASSFEIETTLRAVCERLLSPYKEEPSITGKNKRDKLPKELVLKKAHALKIIGDTYKSTKDTSSVPK